MIISFLIIFYFILTFLDPDILKKDPIKSLSNSFEMPKLEMLENFNN